MTICTNKIIWFGIAGYPEIKSVKRDVCADTRPGRFVGTALCAEVQVKDWCGVVTFGPGDACADDLSATIARAKRCVDYQRIKQGTHKEAAL